MRDFWLGCGHHLLDRDAGGGLVVTDDFLKAYLARPELAPPADACIPERTLHAALLLNPRRAVAPAEIARIADDDARENWKLMVRFRDHLVAHRTVEGAYLDLVRGGAGDTPPLFINQLVHVILRNLLDGCDDPFVLRAAEMFFRPQRLGVHQGSLIAADEETVAGTGPVSPLVAILGLEAGGTVDVLNEENAQSYWKRSDRFDMALDLTAGRRGLAALGEVIERWVAHLLAMKVAVEPLVEAIGVDLAWYVGLDSEATAIGDALWRGEDLDEAVRERIVGLYRLTFPSGELAPVLVSQFGSDVSSSGASGKPVYLILAMSPDRVLRMKPQNLLTGLPVERVEAVS